MSRLRFEVPSRDLLVDEPAAFRVVGADAGSTIRIDAAGIEPWHGRPGRSWAAFVADDAGIVDPSLQPSVDGTYVGVDPFGLWWSLTGPGWDGSDEQDPCEPSSAEVQEWNLTATCGGETAVATLRRRRVTTGATIERSLVDGVSTVRVSPPGPGPWRRVAVLGGSDGLLRLFAEPVALALAGHGFETLGMAYFLEDGCPRSLANIAFEHLVDVLDGFAAGRPTGVMGYSFGAPIALLLGVECAAVTSSAALSGPLHLPPSFGPDAAPDVPAFTYRGRPLAYAVPARPRPPDFVPGTDPIRSADHGTPSRVGFEVPVERLRGPVFVQWAGDDGHGTPSWNRCRPESESSSATVDRLRAFQFPHDVVVQYDPLAGHVSAGPPSVPTVTSARHRVTGTRWDLGGTREANARARAISWPSLIDFFNRTLTL